MSVHVMVLLFFTSRSHPGEIGSRQLEMSLCEAIVLT